jgi:hypothetical protein
MNDIKVECYAGYKADQRPLRFAMGDQILEVREVEDQWYSPTSRHFRVRASDGNIYILRYDEEQDRWSLDAFRRT